jgi:hypothetical protein
LTHVDFDGLRQLVYGFHHFDVARVVRMMLRCKLAETLEDLVSSGANPGCCTIRTSGARPLKRARTLDTLRS